jgi:hypothetical protein
MRLAEDKIKQAILHPEKQVREVAIRYFSRPTTTDASIMPLAIQALEKYGRRQAFSFNHHLNRLPQTEQTIDWCVAELRREFSGGPAERYFYFLDLSRLLCFSDIRLVIPRAAEIFHAPGFDAKQKVAFQERLDMFGWNAAKCWDELHRFCEAEKDKNGIENFGFGHADRIVEALARQPHQYHEQVLAVLSQEVEDYRHNPLKWLQPMMASLAGEMNLRTAIPLLASKLGHPSSVLSDQSLFALAQMGNDEVVEAVCQPFANADFEYRRYASELLGKLHFDATVRWILRILPQESEFRVRLNLTEAVLRHFSFEGLEPARQMVLEGPLIPDVRHLRLELVASCTLMEARFPEFEAWREQARKDDLEDEAKLKEIEGLAYETQGDIKAFVEKMRAKAAVAMAPAAVPQPRPPAPGRLAVHRQTRVGRNDPCPCGSGKKYKVCCMRR